MALLFFPSTSGSSSLEAGFFGPYVRIYIYNYTHKNKHKQINIYIYICLFIYELYRIVSSFDQEKLVVYIRNLQYPIKTIGGFPQENLCIQRPHQIAEAHLRVS